jgi:exodeoxyribonuclease-3
MTSTQPAERSLRVVGLNLLLGGGTRVATLVDAINRLEADVAVLPEFRPTGHRACELLNALDTAGLRYAAWTTPPDPLVPNGVAIVSRTPFASVSHPLATSPNTHRVLQVELAGIDIVGVYFPLDAPKVRFWREEFLPWVGTRLGSPTLVIGDWNSGRHHADEAGAKLLASKEFEAMASTGWTDAWRAIHPDGREYTWYSRRSWNGFRLDHAFLTPALAPRLLDARYDHTTRPDRADVKVTVSDHSAMVVDLR